MRVVSGTKPVNKAAGPSKLDPQLAARIPMSVLVCDDNVVKVTDSGSLNGTYVNGEIVDAATLVNGDVVQIGIFQMLFISGSGAA